jgi:hypothetical protein
MQQNFQLQEPDDLREIFLEIIPISGFELAAGHKSSKGKMDQLCCLDSLLQSIFITEKES